jgi:hypothetical protein
MALALVGGMAVSTTLLTLFVVPAAYSMLDDVIVWNEQCRERVEGLLTGHQALRAPKAGVSRS